MDITYTRHGDYLLPDLDIAEEEKVSINLYGQLHARYLKSHSKATYDSLFLSGKLNRYLHDIGEQAEEMLETLINQMKKAEGITEQLKAQDQMAWVQSVNSIHNRAQEIVFHDLIYN
ncbi:MAG: TnpV protein [Clostridia bacterium]|nr:TnpV protein [Clostridia bacterium]